MNNSLKSIAYAFIARDLEVYIPDGEPNSIVISKLICSNCGQYWHTSLTECYLCGEINYFLYRCVKCGRRHSLTNSTTKCKVCKGKLVKECVNENCPSNRNKDIRSLTRREGGVFDNQNSKFLYFTQSLCNMWKERKSL